MDISSRYCSHFEFCGSFIARFDCCAEDAMNRGIPHMKGAHTFFCLKHRNDLQSVTAYGFYEDKNLDIISRFGRHFEL